MNNTEKLNLILGYKNDIKSAIVAKGGTVGALSTYAGAINALSIGDTSGLENQITELTTLKNGLAEQVVTLTNEKADLNETVATLNNDKETLAGQVDTLTSEKATLTGQVTTLTNEKAELTATVQANATAFEEIKTAIENSGGVVAGVSTYASAITSLKDCVDIGNLWNCNSEATSVAYNTQGFNSNYSLAISYPNAKYVDSYACVGQPITSLYLPKVSSIGSSAFTFCRYLDNVNIYECDTIGSNAFKYCQNLTNVYAPVCSFLGTGAFEDCIKLSKVYIPKLKTVGNNVFNYCTRLSDTYFPQLTGIGMYMFEDCFKLSRIVAMPSFVGYNAFYGCEKLTRLYLLGNTVATLNNSGTFNYTPIAGNTTYTDGQVGSIYVRESLLSDYMTATNWNYFSSRFVGLTDEEIEALENE